VALRTLAQPRPLKAPRTSGARLGQKEEGVARHATHVCRRTISWALDFADNAQNAPATVGAAWRYPSHRLCFHNAKETLAGEVAPVFFQSHKNPKLIPGCKQ